MLQSWVGRPSGGRILSQETSVWELWPSQVDSGNHPSHLPGAGPVLDPDCRAFWTAGSSELLNSGDTCAPVVASFLFHIPPRFCSPSSQSAVMSVLIFGHVGSSVSDAECHRNTNSPECLLSVGLWVGLITAGPRASADTSCSWQGPSQVVTRATCRVLSWVPTEGPQGSAKAHSAHHPWPLSWGGRGQQISGDGGESKLTFTYAPLPSHPPIYQLSSARNLIHSLKCVCLFWLHCIVSWLLARTFPGCGEPGLLLAVACRRLTAVASLAGRVQALGHTGFRSRSSWPQECGTRS